MLDYGFCECWGTVDIEELATYLKRAKKVTLYCFYADDLYTFFRQIFKSFYKVSRDVDGFIIFTMRE